MSSNSEYIMPAEWHRHTATQLHWPSNIDTWPGNRLEKAEEVYCNIIEELHFFEPIHLFVENLEIRNRVMQKLSGRAVELDRITIHQHKINDVWARNCGPIFVKHYDDYVIMDWKYPSLGEENPLRKVDDKIPGYIARKFGIKRVETNMVLEGGSIDVNGAGVLLTIESVLLHPHHKPKFSKREIEEKLMHYLGAEQVIWLKKGLAGDNKVGHVDNITRWLNKDSVVTVVSENPEDVNYDVLQENLETLKSTTLNNGKKLHIETLPLPKVNIPGDNPGGLNYVSASYANFYIINGAVLVPLYDKKNDEIALDLFRRYFPGRKIIGIECTDLVYGKGSIHSITQPWYGV